MAAPKDKKYTLSKETLQNINKANFQTDLPQILRQIGLVPYASITIKSIIEGGNYKTKQTWNEFIRKSESQNTQINLENDKFKKENKQIKEWNNKHPNEPQQQEKPLKPTISTEYVNQGVGTKNNRDLADGINQLYAVLKPKEKDTDPLSHANTRIHVTFPSGSWHTKGADKKLKFNNDDIHIFHITDRSLCPDVTKRCPQKSAWFFDVDRQQWVGFCKPPEQDEQEEKGDKKSKKRKKGNKSKQSKVSCNVGTASDYYVDPKKDFGPPKEGKAKELWDHLKIAFDNPSLVKKDDAHQIGYNQYNQYNQQQQIASGEHRLVHETYPNSDIHSISGINNDVFTASVLIIGIIIVFCIFNTISCVCGATIGVFTDRAIHNREENKLSKRDNENQDNYNEV